MPHRIEKKCQRRLLWHRYYGNLGDCRNTATITRKMSFPCFIGEDLMLRNVFLCGGCANDVETQLDTEYRVLTEAHARTCGSLTRFFQ